MIYVVEIKNHEGATATKEYEASSPHELVNRMHRDLRHHPAFQLVNAWEKSRPDRPLFVSKRS